MPPSPHPLSRLGRFQNSTLLRYLLLFGCGWAIVVLINYFYGMIALFTIAGIFAALLNYPVVWLSRYLPRGIAIALTFTIAVLLFLGFVTLVGLEVLNQGQSLLANLKDTIADQNILPFQDLLNRLEINKLIGTLQTGLASGLDIVRNVFSSVMTVIFGAVICLYMLIDGEKLWLSLLQLLPTASRDRFAQIFQRSFLGFLRGQLLLMVFLFTTCLVVFTILGVKYALILALILGLVDAIPGIGATLGVILVGLLAAASQGFDSAIQVVVGAIVMIQIQDNVLRPKVMGNALELNPVMLFLSLFIGERIAGLLGIFLAVPIAGMIAIWLQTLNQEQQELEVNELKQAILEPETTESIAAEDLTFIQTGEDATLIQASDEDITLIQ
uniref:Permease n=1 Tax=Cyanothece sp. (strain PCC 7425 / ATCC 29141) TaxID=395961 RepID=B8HPG3_CYAP4